MNLSFKNVLCVCCLLLSGSVYAQVPQGLSLKPWGIALKFLFLHHENILFPND